MNIEQSYLQNSRKLARYAATALAIFLSHGAASDSIRMVAPLIPPHFQEDGSGRIADVVSSALSDCGHQVEFVLVPFGRHWEDYRSDESLDGLATAEADQVFPGTTTQPFMHLQDGATVAAHSELSGITSAQQLAGKRVVAFPGADGILGIKDLVPGFESFAMRANRFDQLRPLLAGRADSILADGLITAHFIGVLRQRAEQGEEQGLDVAEKVQFHKIFNPGPQRLYFRRAELAADFDRCFAALKESGKATQLAQPYVEKYRDIVGDQYPVL